MVTRIEERSWSKEEAQRYEASRHGPDGKMFLDPRISNFLDGAKGHILIDAGAGAGAVSIEAIQRGVKYALASDKYPAMVERCQEAIIKAGLQDQIRVEKADVAQLPYKDNAAGRVVSVNVACNLDNPTLAAHFREMTRVVAPDGLILVTLPINLGVVFSNGYTKRAHQRLQSSLGIINQTFTETGEISQTTIQQHLGGIEQIHRATFVVMENGLRMVADDPEQMPGNLQKYAIAAKDMEEGQMIWRKLPGLVVPNNWHTLSTYEKLMREAGLQASKIYDDNFTTRNHRSAYNKNVPVGQSDKKLGAEFVGKGPFAVYILQK